MKFYINNVESVEEKLHLKKNLKRIKLNPFFCERRLKELLKKIPARYDEKTIMEFEYETGIVLKYIVYEHSYDFREHTKLGTYPDKKFNVKDGRDFEEFIKSKLDNYDILVVINDKNNYLD